MTQVVTVDTKIIRNILSTLDELKREVSRLSEKLEEAPPYGSSEWWEWSDKKAIEDIKNGKSVKFDSVEETIKWLNS